MKNHNENNSTWTLCTCISCILKVTVVVIETWLLGGDGEGLAHRGGGGGGVFPLAGGDLASIDRGWLDSKRRIRILRDFRIYYHLRELLQRRSRVLGLRGLSLTSGNTALKVLSVGDCIGAKSRIISLLLLFSLLLFAGMKNNLTEIIKSKYYLPLSKEQRLPEGLVFVDRGCRGFAIGYRQNSCPRRANDESCWRFFASSIVRGRVSCTGNSSLKEI